RRFLHDVAELSGERQMALAGHERRLGDENLAADFGPRQSRRDADFVRLLGHRVAEPRHAEVLRDPVRRDLFAEALAVDADAARDLAADGRQLALEVS